MEAGHPSAEGLWASGQSAIFHERWGDSQEAGVLALLATLELVGGHTQ